jgi:hypothetical protein
LPYKKRKTIKPKIKYCFLERDNFEKTDEK